MKINLRATILAPENCLLLLTVASVFQLAYCVDNICHVDDNARQDCGWSGITLTDCQARKCCWKTPTTHGFPWCFFDSATAAKLHTVNACEHHPPVLLQCSENETIGIHDVFYGRNNGDPLCHSSGITTCFNPNARDIVRNICKNNSTCFVSPRGKVWDFDKNCDALNAQLIVHFVCTSKDRIFDASSSALEASTTATPIHTSQMYAESSMAITSTVHIKAVIPNTGIPTTSTLLASDKVTPTRTISTSTMQVCTCSDVTALSMEIERKDKIIIGLSALLILLALVAVLWVVLLCRKNNWYKVMEKRDDVVHMESTHSRTADESKPNCDNTTYDGVGFENENNTYDGVGLQTENNTYDGVGLQDENNTYDGVDLQDENPYYASS